MTREPHSGPLKGTPVSLRRSLSLPLMVLYGLGTTIGAGIYVLIGSVAGNAGLYTPISFLLASLMAGFTAFSFAELTARYPKSAGEALFAYHAFGKRWLAVTVGLLMTGAVIVSSGAIVRGFTGYLQTVVTAPEWLIIVVLILILGLIAAWGIIQSVVVAALLTLIEIGGGCCSWLLSAPIPWATSQPASRSSCRLSTSQHGAEFYPGRSLPSSPFSVSRAWSMSPRR